jgi:hypothetical protein
MKTLLALSVLVLSTVASASTYKQLPKNSIGLSLLTQGDVAVETPMPHCPPTAMCEVTAILKIKFTLTGCMDKLGPVTIKEVGYTTDGKKKLVVTAYNVHNEASKVTKCFRAPIGVATQVLGFGFMTADDVVVEFAQSTVTIETF